MTYGIRWPCVGAAILIIFTLVYPAFAQERTGIFDRDARQQQNLQRARRSVSDYVNSDEKRYQLQQRETQRRRALRTHADTDEERQRQQDEALIRGKRNFTNYYNDDTRRLRQQQQDIDRGKQSIEGTPVDIERRRVTDQTSD